MKWADGGLEVYVTQPYYLFFLQYKWFFIRKLWQIQNYENAKWKVTEVWIEIEFQDTEHSDEIVWIKPGFKSPEKKKKNCRMP